MEELNFELLKELYCIHSKSGNEGKMRKYILEWISSNVPDAAVKEDKSGSLYVTRGKAESYPCLCAHMDQVQDLHPKDFMCIDEGGIILGFSPEQRKQCGLGADDKNGIFIALSCLQEYDVLKCAFFVGEEIGCVGSSNADMDFFADCRFCAQIDRKGNSDLVTSISSRICSDDFILAANCEAWGYSESSGLMTDVKALAENGVGVSCVNMSCGYYDPHTDYEFTSKRDVRKCHRFMCHLIEDCTDTYPHEYSYADGWRYSEDRYDFADLCVDYISNYPDVEFDDIYELYKDDYPKLDKKEMRKIFKKEKSYRSFGF